MVTLLKKYKMWILVIFGVFIIISFLLADSLQRWAQSAATNQRVFSIAGQKVTNYQVGQASFGVETLRKALPPIDQALGLPSELRVENWLMRSYEAERAGLVGGPTDGRNFASQIARQRLESEGQAALTPEERARGLTWQDKIKSSLGMTDEQFKKLEDNAGQQYLDMTSSSREPKVNGADVFAQFRAITRLQREISQIAVQSGPRLTERARIGDQASIAYVRIDVDERQISEQPTPTEAELLAHFEKFKNVPLNEGDYAMGLQPPDRVAVTRLTIDRSALLAAIKIDPVDVQKKLTAQPAAAGTDPSEHRRNIEQQLRNELADKIIRDTSGAIRADIVRVTGSMGEQDGYRVIPAGFDGSKVDLASIARSVATRMSDQFGLKLPAPIVVAGQLASRRDLQLDPVVSRAVARRGQSSIPALDVVFGVKELSKPRGTIAAQVGLPIADAFEDFAGNTHFLAVTSAARSAPPAAIDDELRVRLSKDVRSLRALDKLKTELDGYRAVAALTSIADVAKTLRSKNYSVVEAPKATVSEFAGISPNDPKANAPDVVKIAMDTARKIDPSQKVDALTAPERTFFIAPAGRLTVMLGQVTEFRPLALEDFRQLAPTIASGLRSREAEAVMRTESSNEYLVKRLGVTDLKLKAGDEQASE